MKFDKILVPLDGSILAEAALWTAVELADGGTLSLLRATEAHTRSGAAQVAAVRKAQQYLRRLIERLNKKEIKNVEGHVWYGPPAAAIIEAAETQKVDLIVLSTHGRSGLGRLILGSVTELVLRGTRTPILVVRADSAPIELQRGAKPATEGPGA